MSVLGTKSIVDRLDILIAKTDIKSQDYDSLITIKTLLEDIPNKTYEDGYSAGYDEGYEEGLDDF